MKTTVRLLAALVFPVLTLGCYSTQIRSGKTPAPGKPALDEILRSQIVGDIVTVDSPDKLSVLCPNGWASVDSEVTPYNVLLDLVAGWFYRAHTVTVRCAASESASAPQGTTSPLVPAPDAAADSGS